MDEGDSEADPLELREKNLQGLRQWRSRFLRREYQRRDNLLPLSPNGWASFQRVSALDSSAERTPDVSTPISAYLV